MVFREAGKMLLSGGNPYDVVVSCTQGYLGFYNPVWTLIPLLPLVILPIRWGWAGTNLAYLAVLVGAGRRWRWGIHGTLAMAVAVHTLMNVVEGQVEWLVLLGALIGGPIGFLLMATKPQLGLGFMAYSLWEDRRYWKRLAAKVGVLLVAGAGNLWLYGLPKWGDVAARDWNLSGALWPWSLLVGLPVLAYAMRTGKEALAGSSSVLLSPYAAWRSWWFIGLGLGGWWLVGFSALTWLLVVAQWIR
jgi:hypothetical protein